MSSIVQTPATKATAASSKTREELLAEWRQQKQQQQQHQNDSMLQSPKPAWKATGAPRTPLASLNTSATNIASAPFRSPNTSKSIMDVKARIAVARQRQFAGVPSQIVAPDSAKFAELEKQLEMIARQGEEFIERMEERSEFHKQLRRAVRMAKEEDMVRARNSFDDVRERFPMALETAEYFITRAECEEYCGDFKQALMIYEDALSESSTAHMSKEEVLKMTESFQKMVQRMNAEKTKEEERRQKLIACEQSSHFVTENAAWDGDNLRSSVPAPPPCTPIGAASGIEPPSMSFIAVSFPPPASDSSTPTPAPTPVNATASASPGNFAGGFSSPVSNRMSSMTTDQTLTSPSKGGIWSPRRLFSPSAAPAAAANVQTVWSPRRLLSPSTGLRAERAIASSPASAEQPIPSTTSDGQEATQDISDTVAHDAPDFGQDNEELGFGSDETSVPLSDEVDETLFAASSDDAMTSSSCSENSSRTRPHPVGHPNFLREVRGNPTLKSHTIVLDRIELTEAMKKKLLIDADYVYTPVKRSARKQQRPARLSLAPTDTVTDVPVIPNPFVVNSDEDAQ